MAVRALRLSLILRLWLCLHCDCAATGCAVTVIDTLTVAVNVVVMLLYSDRDCDYTVPVAATVDDDNARFKQARV